MSEEMIPDVVLTSDVTEVDSISAALDDLEINQSYWSLFN